MINKLVLENLKHRPVRNFLSALVIGVMVTMVLTLVGLSEGVIEDSNRRSKGVGADVLIRAPGSQILSFSTNFPEGILKLVATFPHVKLVTGTLVVPTGGMWNYVTGIDLPAFNAMSGGFRFFEGGPFRDPLDVIVDEVYAKEHHLHAGAKVKILNKEWRICGVVEPGKLARVMVQIAVLRDLTSAGSNKVTMGYVKLDNGADVGQAVAGIRNKLGDYQIYSMDELISLTSVDSVPLLSGFIRVVIGLAVLIGSLVVFLSMYTAVLERTREIGVLKALGATPGYVLNVLLRETTVLAIGGSVLGILLTYVTRLVIGWLLPSMPENIVYGWWPIAGAIALAGSLLGAVYPGLKAARQDAIEALSYE